MERARACLARLSSTLEWYVVTKVQNYDRLSPRQVCTNNPTFFSCDTFLKFQVGYPEALTDPSYHGQILVLTFPMVGNYGVPADTVDENGISMFFESSKIQVAGLIVSNYSSEFSHWNAATSLGDWLSASGIPALFGIDTRRLTKKLRSAGTILGKIEFPSLGLTTAFDDPNAKNLVELVSTKDIRVYGEGKSPRIIAYDCGMKLNIVRHFIYNEDVCLIVVPFDYDLANNPARILYDGIFLSNGPGDPTMCTATIASLAWALQQEPPKPIFGICLGNKIE